MTLKYPKPLPRSKATKGHGLHCHCKQCLKAVQSKTALKTQRKILRDFAKAEGTLQRVQSQFSNEEEANLAYLQIEVKEGSSANLPLFFTRAFDQAERAVAIGSNRKPVVVLVAPEGPEFALLLKNDLLELVRLLASFERGLP